jgi:hypothetical protein
MKTIGLVMAVLLIMLSGCAAQTTTITNGQLTPVQTESTEPADASEEEPEQAGAVEISGEIETAKENISETENSEAEDTMRLLIGETEVPVTWEENASVEALRELCPVTIQMSMYGGFEQVGPIGQSIVRDDIQTSTGYGDIVLYSGNQIVIFYGSNSWAYTRLGHIALSQKEMNELLSNGDVTITLE